MDPRGLQPSQSYDLFRAIQAGQISFDALLAFPVDWDSVASSLAAKKEANSASVAEALGPTRQPRPDASLKPDPVDVDEGARRVRRKLSPDTSGDSPRPKRSDSAGPSSSHEGRRRAQRMTSPLASSPTSPSASPSDGQTGMEAGLRGLEISSESALGLRLSPALSKELTSTGNSRSRSTSAPSGGGGAGGPLLSHWRWHESWPEEGTSLHLPVIDELDPRSPAPRDDCAPARQSLALIVEDQQQPQPQQEDRVAISKPKSAEADNVDDMTRQPRSTSVHWQGSWGLRKPKMRLSLSMLRPYFPSI